MNNKKILFLYITWGFLSFLLFLYLLFPKDLLSKLVTTVVEDSFSEIHLKFDSIAPVLPPGVKFEDIDIFYLDNLIYKANYLKISPGVLSLLSDSKYVNFSAAAYKGLWKCKVKFSEENISLDTVLQDVRLDLLPVKQFLPDYRLSGIVSVDSSCDLVGRDIRDGDIDLKIKDFKIRLGNKILGIRRLLFSDVKLMATAKDNKMEIKNFTIAGKQISGNLTGTIDIKFPYEQSILDLKGNIDPDADFIKKMSSKVPIGLMLGNNFAKGGIPFTLKGTIEAPDFNPEL